MSKKPKEVSFDFLDGPMKGQGMTLTMQDCEINYDAEMVLWERYRYAWNEEHTGLLYVGEVA